MNNDNDGIDERLAAWMMSYETRSPGATVAEASDLETQVPVELQPQLGRVKKCLNLLAALRGDQSGEREYLTSRFDNTVWYRDDRWWVIIDVDRSHAHVFDVEADPELRDDVAGEGGEPAEALERAWGRSPFAKS